MKVRKLEFHWALLFLLLMMLSLISSFDVLENNFKLGIFGSVLFDLIPKMGWIYFAASWVAYRNETSLSDAFLFLGFKKINLTQILFGLILLIPLSVGHFLIYCRLSKAGELVDLTKDWPLYLMDIIFTAGIFEEAIFRGLIFRWLRQKRTFFSSAFLSGFLWSLSHLINLYHADLDQEKEIWRVVGEMTTALILSFPAAYVFEKCGNILWPWAIVHTGIDTFFLLDDGIKGSVNLRLNSHLIDFEIICIILLAFFCITLLAFFLPRWFWPPKKSKRRKKWISIVLSQRAVNKFNKPLFLIPLGLFLLLFLGESATLLPITFDWKVWSEILKDQRESIEKPNDSSIFLDWGLNLLELGRYEEAISKFEKAAVLDPKNADAVADKGMALVELERYQEALMFYEKAVELDPTNDFRRHLFIKLLLKAKEDQKAISEIQKALRLNPKDVMAYDLWGETLLEMHQNGKAIEKFQKVIEITPSNALAYRNWGVALYQLGRYKEALVELKMAIQKNQDGLPSDEVENEKALISKIQTQLKK
jgi:tetratricopeptide (TPR) repeat protein/membrane protease YdiL (CAAX protease family)